MSLRLNSALLEKLAEGLIFLNKKGVVTDFNRAAQPWLKHFMTREKELSAMIDDVTLGVVRAPVNIASMYPSSPHSADFHLCQNGVDGFSIFITAQVTAPAVQTIQEESFNSLLSEDFRHELSDFRQLLEQTSPRSTADIEQLNKQSLRLSRLLISMENLCELHQTDAFHVEERVSLQNIIQEAIAELPSRRSDYSINPELSGEAGKQGMVFGHARWLKVAIEGILEGIGASAPPHCRVEIRVRQNCGFVVMTGAFSSFFSHRSAVAMIADHPGPTLTTDADLNQSICRRIVALHGGQLKIVPLDPAQSDVMLRGIESFTLILPTGAPSQGRGLNDCANCLYSKQAELYAQDLAYLMPRKPAGTKISKEELDCLAHISTRSFSVKKIPTILR
ncbi:hypothetical protein [Rhodoferax sp. PAMC 29310]|uniref:hypothetical protein n=1 Tax=Rhodoferax sp. PAMC 29310 TaxID=2822760 RepID=UPI001B31DB8C|nr:hypothetical protein [Rhodoferax sp. PAMC 29310]